MRGSKNGTLGTPLDALPGELREPPDHVVLGTPGRWAWDGMMNSLPWLRESDLLICLRIAQLEDEYALVRFDVFKYKRPADSRKLRAIEDRQTRLTQALGMDPASRTAIGPGEVMGARQAAKLAEEIAASAPERKALIPFQGFDIGDGVEVLPSEAPNTRKKEAAEP